MKLDGEWNSVINIKHRKEEGEEEFLNVTNLPIFKRKIQKISAQDPGESKRRWFKVTEALARGDAQGAADGKHEVRE